jgi:hypothetical protein
MTLSIYRLLSCSAAVTALASGLAHAQDLNRVNKEITEYSPVMQERLNAADPSDWLLRQARLFTGQGPKGFIHGSNRSQDIVAMVFQD